jgi:hypothetical protein
MKKLGKSRKADMIQTLMILVGVLAGFLVFYFIYMKIFFG